MKSSAARLSESGDAEREGMVERTGVFGVIGVCMWRVPAGFVCEAPSSLAAAMTEALLSSARPTGLHTSGLTRQAEGSEDS